MTTAAYVPRAERTQMSMQEVDKEEVLAENWNGISPDSSDNSFCNSHN